MSADAAAKTPWEFRLRAVFIGIAFGCGFFFGAIVQGIAFHGDQTPTFILLGRPFGIAGVEIAAWVSAAFGVAAWLIRLWGSSYHSPGVVMSGDVVTDTLTAAGPYRYVRNPLYLGNVLLAIGIGSLGPPAATVLVIGLNVWFAYRLIAIEERFMRNAQGKAYEKYCAAVPRLFPRLTPAPLPEDPHRPNLAYGFLTELFSLGFACAMVYVAIAVIRGSGSYGIGFAFWGIAVLAIVMQIILSPAARRAGNKTS